MAAFSESATTAERTADGANTGKQSANPESLTISVSIAEPSKDPPSPASITQLERLESGFERATESITEVGNGDRDSRTEVTPPETPLSEDATQSVTDNVGDLLCLKTKRLAPETSTLSITQRPPLANDSKRAPNIPGCEILGELGRGGMGVVYWVWQSSLNRTAALKMLLAGAHAGSDSLARFRTETQAIARLQHGNIVQVFEVGAQEGLPYLIQEYVDGGSLAGKLAEGPLFPRRAAQLLETLARAVHHAHQRGVIHRDLKPSNVLLTCDGIPKITDFGLAKIVAGGDQSHTQSGSIMGTPSYMAPEQASGKTVDVGPGTDIYALGAILYATLTAHPPFQGTTVLETLEQVQRVEPVPPRRLQEKVPKDLETICLKCLQKNLRQRYLTAEALADDLHRFLTLEPIHARPTPLWERGMKWAMRRPALAALLHVSVAAVLTVLAVSLWFNARLQSSNSSLEISLANVVAEKTRADEEHARAERQEQARRRYVQSLRQASQDLLVAGQEAESRQDWAGAKFHLIQARAKIGSEPELNDLSALVARLLEEAERRLEDQAARRAASDKYQEFVKLHDKALFHGTLFMGMDEPLHLKETATVARQALHLFGLSENAPVVLNLAPLYLTAEEKGQITDRSYELFLLLAEAVARTPSAQGLTQDRARAREALSILDQAKSLGPSTHAFHLRRMKYLDIVGDQDGEEVERRLAKAVPPTTASDFFLIGDQNYRADNVPTALDHFQRALRVDPKHFWAQYFAAACQLKLERPREAIAHLTACAGRRPTEFPWIYLLRGYAHGMIRDFVTAEADFQKALQLAPLESVPVEYGVYVNRAAMRIQQGKLDEASADLKDAIQLNPEPYQAYLNLAEVARLQEDDAKAERCLDEALRRAPSLPRVYSLRALVREAKKDLPLALEDLDQAVRLTTPGNPRLAEYQYRRGRILHELKRFEPALEAYQVALAIKPDHADALRMSADVLLALNRGADARAALDRYLKDAKDAAAYRQRGFEKAKNRDYAGALSDYTRSLDIEPNAASTHARRGWAFLNEATQLAFNDFEAAIKNEPRNSDLYNGRGCALVLLGRHREGVRDAEEALRLGPASAAKEKRFSLTYNAACVYAQAAGKLMASEESDRAQLVERYTVRAVDLLRQALANVPAAARTAQVRQVVADPAFIPIRHSALFVDLTSEAAPKK
jgi:serine/threonine protein kinase/Tfp pilus assembly protein PilF